ncbi:SOS response-associated peptidase [Sulfitobacter sp. LCG007]
MPGRLFLTAPLSELAALLGTDPGPVADEPPRRNIAPGQPVVAYGSSGLGRMRWGIVPVGRVNARGRPVMETIVNARSETVFDKSAFTGTGRAVLPVNGWYEWTGSQRRKTAWAIRSKTDPFLFFAAIRDIWIAPDGQKLAQVAPVTCEPSADVRDIHHRMGVLLRPQDIPLWLEGAPEDVKPLMRPWPDGSLEVLPARDVDWAAP